MEHVDVIIIGAGQAGLAAGYHLQRAGYRFLLLEAGTQASGAWRGYYDSLTLFSPARYSALPGLAFPAAPGHYPSRDEVAGYLEDYARHFDLPIRYGQRVSTVRREGGGFWLQTAEGKGYVARAVIAASGAFGTPFMPSIPGLADFGGRVLHSGSYRDPADFAGHRVVVVGGANSGVQIACELADTADVSLATRRPIRFFPQRVLGLDFHFWLAATGLERTRWLDDQSTPVLDDGRYRRAIKSGKPARRPMFREAVADEVVWADGKRERVDTLLFATGFRPHMPYLADLGVVTPEGLVRQHQGIALDVPGLYFVGLSRQRNFASATLRGVGPDAAWLMSHLAAHLQSTKLQSARAWPA
ncbi:monooxygenase [Chitinimonas prasina]|uniref:Monooxygenase n=1 Tax=Chitinimonas prasina TaxID=1434937 RepID=A0ABQ5YHW5_9NEIS|nr:FAD-dependent oxidoreductase [Chitinimonas prasina]GLR13534.1 monooxygenase [Chitinimonas prasina]